MGETAGGNTALLRAGAGLDAGAIFGAAIGFAAEAGVVGDPVVAGAVVVVSEPHSAFRKSFHFIPLSVPAL